MHWLAIVCNWHKCVLKILQVHTFKCNEQVSLKIFYFPSQFLWNRSHLLCSQQRNSANDLLISIIKLHSLLPLAFLFDVCRHSYPMPTQLVFLKHSTQQHIQVPFMHTAIYIHAFPYIKQCSCSCHSYTEIWHSNFPHGVLFVTAHPTL